MRHLPTYNSWSNMKQRCNNPNHPHYDNYGGRGITYDSRWEQFENFLEDMGERPERMTLERKNNNQGYSKVNCKWASRIEQNNNKRSYTSSYNHQGVCWSKRYEKWRSYYYVKKICINLYYGPDFFEAICRRKSFEVRHGK